MILSERKVRRIGAVGTKGDYCPLLLITLMATEASSEAALRYPNI